MPQRRLAPLTVLAGVAVCWLIFDQLTKFWALAQLPERRSQEVIGEMLQWYLTYNPGAAFSFLANATWVFTLIAAAVVVTVLLKARHVESKRWAVVIGLLLGGTTGNLVDRLFRAPGFAIGHVVDFIHTPWLVPAVYNVADIGLTLAVVGAIALLITNVPLRRVAAEPATPQQNESEDS